MSDWRSDGYSYDLVSITIGSSMTLSVVVALIVTPALCAALLKPAGDEHPHERHGFFGWFNRKFDASNRKYESGVRRFLKRSGRVLLIYLALIIAMGVMFTRIPKAFLPDEDQGIMFVQVTAPPGATISHTDEALRQIREYLLNDEKQAVKSVFTISGFNFSGRGQNSGLAFVSLKDWAERSGDKNKVQTLATRVMHHFSAYRDAQIIAVAPPAVTRSEEHTSELQSLMRISYAV